MSNEGTTWGRPCDTAVVANVVDKVWDERETWFLALTLICNFVVSIVSALLVHLTSRCRIVADAGLNPDGYEADDETSDSETHPRALRVQTSRTSSRSSSTS